MSEVKEKIIILTKSRWLPWILVFALIVAGGVLYKKLTDDADERETTYNRQVAGMLSESEREMQEFNKEMGLAESKLLSQEELLKKYKKDITDKDELFEAFKKKHNLKIKNYEIVIAELKQKIEGGTTTTVIVNGECNTDENGKLAIEYSYKEKHGRVSLSDPDIFVKDNETLELSQKFKVQGEVLEQKDGSLQTKRVKVFEVIAKQRADGTIEYENIAEASLIDASFNYSNEPDSIEDQTWSDKHLDTFNPIIGVGEQLYPGFYTLGSVGIEWFNFKDVGLGITTKLDLNTGKIENSGASIGLSYHFPKTNLGINGYVGTPFRSFFQKAYVGVELVFYILK